MRAIPGFVIMTGVLFHRSVSGMISTRVEQIFVEVATKTKDNVFVNITVAVQFSVLPDPKAKYDGNRNNNKLTFPV